MAQKLTLFPNDPNKEPDKQFDQIQTALLTINAWANRINNDVIALQEEGVVGETGPTGPTGPQGPQGDAGVVSGTYPIIYNSGTQTISIDPSGLSGYYLPLSGGTMSGNIATAASGTNLIGASGVPFSGVWANEGHFANIYGFSPITVHDNVNLSKTTPEFKLTDTNYSRITRSGSTNLLDIYNQVSVIPATASGGTYTTYTSGGITYAVHTFSSGTGTFSPATPTNVNYLVVAGGGGGGSAGVGGGGGGGGVLTGSTTISSPVNISVGEGGASNTNGSNSVISGVATAIGGGRGGNYPGNNSQSGGSGGGAGDNYAGSAGTVGQGNAGGSGYLGGTVFGGGGGGGAGSAGGGTVSYVTYAVAGNGGSGVSSSINGTPTFYGGGGGGGGYQPYGNIAGSGTHGGGNGGYTGSQNGFAGTEGVGAGGGGAAGGGGNVGGKGGRGVVIISYPISTTIQEVNVLKSEDSATPANYGKTTLGNDYTEAHINGGSIYFDINSTNKSKINSAGVFLIPSGIVCTAPNGSQWLMTVSNSGTTVWTSGTWS